MKAIDLFEKEKEYSKDQVVSILKENNFYYVKLFYNRFGWNTYFTVEPTFATPSGVLYKEGFPAKVNIAIDQKYNPTVTPIKFTV